MKSVALLLLLVAVVVADESIYTDSVLSPFSDWSYATTRTPQDSTEAHSGSYSYSFLPSDYQAVYFEDTNAFDTTVYAGVQFWVYIPTGGDTNIEVDIIKSGSAISPNKQLSTYLVSSSTITYNTWLEGFVNFSQYTTGQYDGVWWQDKSGNTATVKVYLDDVKLVSKTSSGSSTTATTAATTAATHATTATTATTAATHATTATTAAATTAATVGSTTTGSGTSTGGSSGTGSSDPTVQAYFTSGKQNTQATYYGVYTNGGTCTLDPTPPVGTASQIYTTVALATTEFDNSETCGICLNVTYLGTGSGASPPPSNFLVYVNNLCPSCVDAGIDLGMSGDGVWNINWIAVPCPVTSNIQYLFQGSNSYYLKIQARNTKYPVYQFALLVGGSYVQLERSSDNFFEAPSGFTGFPLVFPLSIKLTATNGETVTDTVASLVNSEVIQGSVQFS